MAFLVEPLIAQVPDSVFSETLYTKGWQYIHTHPDSARLLFEKAKMISERLRYFPGVARYYIYNAALQVAQGNNGKAIKYYDQAIAITKNNKLPTDLGLIYMKKGTLYQFMEDYSHAGECYLAAASFLQTNEDRKKIIGLYKNILSTLSSLQQENQSLQNVLPALKNENTSENEIVSILSQKKTYEGGLEFPDQTTLSEITGGEVYVIFGGAKFLIPDFYVLRNYSNYRSIRKIPDGLLSRIPDIPREGTILKQAKDKSETVWLIKDKLRHRIDNPAVLQFFGGWDALCIVPENTLEQVPDAGDVVTMQNVLTTFNFKHEYEVLLDTLKSTLIQNAWLLNEVGKQLKEKNSKLQNRKILLWTFLVGIMALLAIAFLLVRNSRQKQKLHLQSFKALKVEEELQRKSDLEKERTRIASDMHDDLGAGLTGIKFLSENIEEYNISDVAKERLEKLKDSANKLIESMGEIIWAMNEKNNTLEDLLFHLRSYSLTYCEEYNLTCRFNLPENIYEQIISGYNRRNIFLIVKECLHNIVKHGKAKNVEIRVDIKKDLVFEIQDDGIGFHPGEPIGNGLINMRKRAKEMNGTFVGSDNNGTCIQLSIPLH
ncbi:MAG TPA: ATP-binding protein [Ferruginibacter sp.]|nr:ATP-binding protein [Ferruginibacter sp.]